VGAGSRRDRGVGGVSDGWFNEREPYDRDSDPPKNSPDFCWSHYVIEPMPDNCYRVCGECMHAFPTEADLIRDMWMEWGDYRHAGDQVHSCPHCIHDF
jgi:hypothetical protein